MPALIEGVDLVALCAILLLIGLLTAVRYSFVKLADVLDVGIFGYRPFKGIATAIENTIVAGCNEGIKALGSVAHDLWVGAKWSFNEAIKALMYVPNKLHAAIDYLWHTAIPSYVKAYVKPYADKILTLETKIEKAITDEGKDVLDLSTRISNLTSSIPGEINKRVGSMASTLRGEFTSGIDKLRGEVTREIDAATKGIEGNATEAIDRLKTAEQSAIDSVQKAEDATAKELKDLLGRLDLTTIMGAVAAVPLINAAVNTLEAESGLGRAECRAKVKNICSTDPSIWENLLAGLVALGLTMSIAEILEAANEYAQTQADSLELLSQG